MAYRFIEDAGHGWLEVPRQHVQDSGAPISGFSYYDPATDMVYLEEDCDMGSFLEISRLDDSAIDKSVYRDEWSPRGLPSYEQDEA